MREISGLLSQVWRVQSEMNGSWYNGWGVDSTTSTKILESVAVKVTLTRTNASVMKSAYFCHFQSFIVVSGVKIWPTGALHPVNKCDARPTYLRIEVILGGHCDRPMDLFQQLFHDTEWPNTYGRFQFITNRWTFVRIDRLLRQLRMCQTNQVYLRLCFSMNYAALSGTPTFRPFLCLRKERNTIGRLLSCLLQEEQKRNPWK